MKEIGGYFGLELESGKEIFHETPYHFKSGRSSLSFILQHEQPKKVYVPFYTCDALLEPFIENNISYSFYSINEAFEIVDLPQVEKGELIVYVNYYDLKRKYVEYLSDLFKDKLVVDCTQSYFVKGNNTSWFFNSARKFFGVPDGSDLYIPDGKSLYEEYEQLSVNESYLVDHLLLRFNGHTQKGYDFFKQNEVLNNSDICKMSLLSTSLLSRVDFSNSIQVRENNFRYLHMALKNSNLLALSLTEKTVSNFYPYLPSQYIGKEVFWNNKVFVPILWEDCIKRNMASDFNYESTLCKKLIPIPIDHRYGLDDMQTIVKIMSTYGSI